MLLLGFGRRQRRAFLKPVIRHRRPVRPEVVVAGRWRQCPAWRCKMRPYSPPTRFIRTLRPT